MASVLHHLVLSSQEFVGFCVSFTLCLHPFTAFPSCNLFQLRKHFLVACNWLWYVSDNFTSLACANSVISRAATDNGWSVYCSRKHGRHTFVLTMQHRISMDVKQPCKHVLYIGFEESCHCLVVSSS